MAIMMKNHGRDDWELNPNELNLATEASPWMRKLLPVICNEQGYQAAVARLDGLMLAVRGDDNHALAPYLHSLGTLVSEYEREHFPMEDADPVEILEALMDEHHLTQSDLPEIGNQAKVSEILHGKRKLNTRQIQNLSRRFNVSPAVFFMK